MDDVVEGVEGAKHLKDQRSLYHLRIAVTKARSTLQMTEYPYAATLTNLASTLRKRVQNTCAAGALTASENPGECATGRAVVNTVLSLSGRAGGE